MCTYKLIFMKKPQRNQGVGIIYRDGRANADGRYHFQILWTLPFQFLKDIFDETRRGPVKTLRAVVDTGRELRGLQSLLWEVFKLVWLPMSIPFSYQK